jgi:tartrate dehydrogenase/decarboxylase/D-malate dehydrogenase
VTNAYQIALIPGDGIGTEVVPAARRVLDLAAERRGFKFGWDEYDWGCEYFLRTGRMMPDDGLDVLSRYDSIFLGAVGYPGVPDHISLWGLLIPIRRTFEQYINLRPIKLLPGIESPLRGVAPGSIDFVCVRENNEGEYSEIGGRLYRGTPREIAIQDAVFTRHGVERCIRYALELARSRAGRLVSATKSNGIIHTMPFWDEVSRDQHSRYGDVDVRQVHVDALAALMVLRPQDLDVVVASNLFGDILTDLGAAVVGSIGIAPSANLNPEREHPSMFEPVHGSAPDIAGTGTANPIGQVWAGAMMLEHLGERQAAGDVMAAVEHALASDDTKTRDLGGSASTEECTTAMLAALESREIREVR